MFNLENDSPLKSMFDVEPSDIPVPDITKFAKKFNSQLNPNSCGEIPIRGEDYVIGCVTDYSWNDIKIWYNSLVSTGYNGHIVLLVYNMDKETIQKCIDNGIEIWSVGQPKDNGDLFYKNRNEFNICVSRFYHLWMFINHVEDIGRVVVTDVKDVVFQNDPLVGLSRFVSYEKPVVLTSESVKYKNEDWGINNIRLSFGPMITKTMEDNIIYNAGVIGGVGDVVKDLFLEIFLICRGLSQYVQGGGGPDQAALNILANSHSWKPLIRFVMSEEGLAVQAGTTNDPNKNFELEDLKPVMIKSNEIVTTTGRPFAIIHQYDRVPEWKEFFVRKYGNS